MQTLTPELQKLLVQLSQHLQSEPDKNPPLLEIWDAWVEDLDLSPRTKAGHYHSMRRQIVKANPLSLDTAWFTSNTWAASTHNRRLWLLKKMSAWAVTERLLTANPWLKTRQRKTVKKLDKPFSRDEAAKIIAGFKES